jgi:hypothetical protein
VAYQDSNYGPHSSRPLPSLPPSRINQPTTLTSPGAGTGAFQGTLPSGFAAINPKGTIAGAYVDANNGNHGFVRARDGTITTFDVPDAGAGAFQGTSPFGINAQGAITGYYIDASNVGHGFLRTAQRCENCEEE